jgi:hypothetical protein
MTAGPEPPQSGWDGSSSSHQPAITIGEAGLAAAAIQELPMGVGEWPPRPCGNTPQRTATQRSRHF